MCQKQIRFSQGFSSPQGDDIALQKTRHDRNNKSSLFSLIDMFEQKE